MLKRSITYENPFTNEQVTEEHYFHISKADLVEMEMEEHADEYTDKEGNKLTGMQAKLQRIIDAQDGHAILNEFKDVIRRAYGKRDGNNFRKSKAIWEEFASTEAYSQLLWDLSTDAGEGASFFSGILPGNLEQVAAETKAKIEASGGAVAASSVSAIAAFDEAAEQTGAPSTSDIPDEPRMLTSQEVVDMPADELKSGIATGKYKLS